ncbi:MAG TPA: choice-of-anchor D domain-containing protein, partial [Acidimicrobiales bacterium]|nr:choice-of-anchor D domain-containing protein [Acidimicrobiales bacterium]
VGPAAALVLHLPVVSDGTVDVALAPVVGQPSLKGLELVTTSADVPPVLSATPAALDVGPVPVHQRGGSAVSLANIGTTGPLTVTGTALTGPQATLFADRPGPLPITLAPGESTTVPVDLLPTYEGLATATLTVANTGAGGSLAVPLSGTGTAPPSGTGPAFGRGTLGGAGVSHPTSLQFGPDGRLYVAQIDGTIKALTVTRDAAGSYQVTLAETLGHIRSIPNHDDRGGPAPAVTTRLVTGLLVAGTAAAPVVYAVSSDPRIGAGTSGTDLDLDTNSGVLSRLTRAPTGWQKVDLVRGLPRSEENHTGNGLALDPATGDLLIAYGGNTNMGAPSHNFAGLAEYALSGAVLAVDLDAIGSTTYDLPTLDDEDRPGTADAGDPFGGNNGKNQARLVPGGPVRVYAAGFRNPYDLVRTTGGRLYTVDNGANAGWGGAPLPDDATGTCTNDPVEPGTTDGDSLFHITGPGFYGGHPNPTRANRANLFNAGNAQSPVDVADPVECDYRSAAQAGALAGFAFSTNGLDEYTATTFGGDMQGDLLAASFDKAIYRIELDATGTRVTRRSALVSTAGALPLDVTAQGDGDPFPGTIWVADFGGDAIAVFEPQITPPCTGADDPALDEDGDGFANADEILNGTNPCSAADTPPDADGDGVSDRGDPDDDGDGLPDTVDRFALDAADGRTTPLPVVLTWDNDAPPAGGLLGLGFTGLMADGTTDYLDRFDPAGMTAGGAAGVLTVDAVTDGDALGPGGTQDNGFQLGIDVSPAGGPFVAHTRLPAPFAGLVPAGGESYGLFVGDGTQDGYVKVVVAANGGAGGFALVDEQGGVPVTVTVPGPVWPGPGVVDLFLRVDPAAGTVQASASIDGGPPFPVGPPRTVPAAWFGSAAGPAVGIISTSAGPAPPFPATWDFLEVQPAG